MRLILLLLFAWVALACNTTQRLATCSRTETIDTTTRVATVDSTVVRERSELHTVKIDATAFDELEVVVLEYDTTRPVDTIPGTPPIGNDPKGGYDQPNQRARHYAALVLG